MKEMGLKNRELSRPERFALLEASGVPATKAAKQAGYHTNPATIRKSADYQRFRTEIRQKRAALSLRDGFGLGDSAKWYKDLSNDKSIGASVRIRARELLDKLLGYFAPLEIEQDKPDEQRPIIALIQILQQHNINPLHLIREASYEAVNLDINNAISTPTTSIELENDDLPIKSMSHYNQYVNNGENGCDGIPSEGEESAAEEEGGPAPNFFQARGGTPARGESPPYGIPSPYHLVELI